MGAIAARHARTVLGHVERILAIELLCAAQALDLRLELVRRAAGARGPASPRPTPGSARRRPRTSTVDREPGPDIAAATAPRPRAARWRPRRPGVGADGRWPRSGSWTSRTSRRSGCMPAVRRSRASTTGRCDYWEDADRGSKAARLSGSSRRQRRRRRRPAPANPFAPTTPTNRP